MERAGHYPWSSFACHGLGHSDPLLDRLPGYDALASIRRHGSDVGRPTCIMPPEEAELAAIRRSSETGLPYGECVWVDRLCRQLNST